MEVALTPEEIKANIVKREDYITRARVVHNLINKICDFEVERRVEFFEQMVSTICAEKLPSQMTKNELLDTASNWIKSILAVYNDSKDLMIIRFLTSELSDLIAKAAMMRCGGS